VHIRTAGVHHFVSSRNSCLRPLPLTVSLQASSSTVWQVSIARSNTEQTLENSSPGDPTSTIAHRKIKVLATTDEFEHDFCYLPRQCSARRAVDQ
jgi:hypothetical protein